MTKIAQISDKSSSVAWSPVAGGHEDIVAIGTKDGGGIGFDDTGGELEFYDMNLTSRTDPALLASVKTQSRFASLGWSVGGATLSGKYPLGMVAGGMENGAVHVWDPQAVMQQQSSEQALIASYNEHGSGAIKALQFNKLVPGQLATGGSDGKVLILDLNQPGASPFMPADDNTQQRAPITSIAWNTQVPHILASAAGDGTVSIWDLNTRKKWNEVRAETSGQPISAVAWNPQDGMQLLTASGDDRNPVIKVWQLSTSTSMPMATLSGHSQGILSMAWCPHDEHLLLSSGKDNRTILWDLYGPQPIGDVPNDPEEQQQQAAGNESSMFGLASSQQRRYDVQWSSTKRGIISTASLDRKVQIHSILGLASSSGRPPKWMRPSSSVSCGFGGTIVHCGATDRAVRIRTVVEEPALEKISNAFEASMDPNNLIAFCQSRSAAAQDAGEKQIWLFMSVIFEQDARHHMSAILGFDPTAISAKAAAYTEDTDSALTNGVGNMSLDEQRPAPMSHGTQEVVKQALMVGNFDAAVECCFNTRNFADALFLASCGDGDLWAKTRSRYIESQSSKRDFLNVANAAVQQDFATFVQNSDPLQWRETLAILSTYSSSEQFHQLCESLGDLLESAGDHANASLCYMGSLNLDKAIKYWRTQLAAQNGGTTEGNLNLNTLHEFVVKASVYLQAVGRSAVLSLEDAELFSKYAEKLAEQGLLVPAAKYCKGDSEESKILRDRLYRSRASQACLAAMGGRPPEFPFTMLDIKQARAPTRTQQNSQRTYGRANASAATGSNGYRQQQPQQQGYAQQQQQQQSYASQQAPAPAAAAVGALPAEWTEVQDPSSGMSYYYNQTTGETTWDRPQAVPAPAPAPPPAPVQAQTPTRNTRNTKLASKYGDGFVSSASHPELASQYGNVGTSNPYHSTARPGTAQVAAGPAEKAPVSGNVETIPELDPKYQPISETLLSLAEALKGGQLASNDKRQLSEGEKGVAIFAKRLARGEIGEDVADKMLAMTTALSSYDWNGAASIQTALVSQEWRNHKEWLKGIKALVQLATKLYSR